MVDRSRADAYTAPEVGDIIRRRWQTNPPLRRVTAVRDAYIVTCPHRGRRRGAGMSRIARANLRGYELVERQEATHGR